MLKLEQCRFAILDCEWFQSRWKIVYCFFNHFGLQPYHFFHQTVKIKGGFEQKKKYEFAKLPRWFKRNSASKLQLCKNGVIWEEGFGTENEWDSFMTLNSTKILLCSPTILPYKNKAETQCGKNGEFYWKNISWNQFAVYYDSCWFHGISVKKSWNQN